MRVKKCNPINTKRNICTNRFINAVCRFINIFMFVLTGLQGLGENPKANG